MLSQPGRLTSWTHFAAIGWRTTHGMEEETAPRDGESTREVLRETLRQLIWVEPGLL